MIRGPASDFWRVGIAPADAATWLQPGTPERVRDRVIWLPEAGSWCYRADPFGVRRGGSTHVFVEAFDYRTKHAVIEHHELGPELAWRGKSTVLAAPYHLSYPFIVEADGEVFMVPESHRANEIALYRARAFPGNWVREAVLLDGLPAAEPSLIRHEGRWWMFFTVVGPQRRDQRELHVAWSERLTGPWRLHGQNPVRDDRTGARPGGTPFVENGTVVLPVQDCGETYGGALRFLRFRELTPRAIAVERAGPRLTGDQLAPAYPDGFHTLAACGGLTLFDVKRIERSWARRWIDLRRRLRRKRPAG